MGFNTSLFLVWFLPVFLLLYLLIGNKIRNGYLLITSILIYAWSEPKFVFVLLATTTLDFLLVKIMHRQKEKYSKLFFLVLSITINVGLLFYYKYYNFFIENINTLFNLDFSPLNLILPLGISFYTFETITYVVDVYRGENEPQKKLSNYMLYIFLFPKMIAGPIIQYREIGEQLDNRSRFDTIDYKLNGFYRFSIGLAKKVLIANQLYIYGIGKLFYVNPESLNATSAWLGIIGFTFQIYFDFSAYSDMAIGLGKIMGFNFPENFDSPFLAKSITEFWKRWHITLGSWIKNYLYIPLGGNKGNSIRAYFNLWLVFFISGLWHKASWPLILWGSFHGTLIIIDKLFLLKLLEKLPDFVKIITTFFIITISLVLFKVDDLGHVIDYYRALFFSNNVETIEIRTELWIPLLIAILFSFINYFNVGKKIQNYFYGNQTNTTRHIVLTLISIVLFTLSLSFNTREGLTQFIYFRF